MTSCSAPDQPSAWVVRFASLIPAGEVLDLACGHGRHARFLAAQGHSVLAIDRDGEALAALHGDRIRTQQLDLEGNPDHGPDWPLQAGRFAGIVVTNYLHRPLLESLLASLAPGGVLLYETFAQGNERYGRPANPEFLLAPNELLELARIARPTPLLVLAFEAGQVDLPKRAVIQRICAMRPDPAKTMTDLPLL
jgi:SAM-dependent methyltransferase